MAMPDHFVRPPAARHTVIEDCPQLSIECPKLPREEAVKWFDDPPLMVPDSGVDAVTSWITAEYLTPATSTPASGRSSPFDEFDPETRGSEHTFGTFDELYDITDDSEGELPIRLSHSVKERLVVATNDSNQRSSFYIPSPREWPTIQKLKASNHISLTHQVATSIARAPRKNAAWTPSKRLSSTPSLTDSSSGDDTEPIPSCPSTPENGVDEPWRGLIHLDTSCLDLLRHLAPAEDDGSKPETSFPSPVGSNTGPSLPLIKLDIEALSTAKQDTRLNALSIPSPDAFFDLLDSPTRKYWTGLKSVPTSTVAAEFYGIPFREAGPEPFAAVTSGPREPAVLPTCHEAVTDAVEAVDEIDETYNDVLETNAAANIDRTRSWLATQSAYMDMLCEGDAIPRSELSPAALPLPASETAQTKSVPVGNPFDQTGVGDEGPVLNPEFLEGWKHLKSSSRARDVFQHRQARTESTHVMQAVSHKAFVAQLRGKFEIQRSKGSHDTMIPPPPPPSLAQDADRTRETIILAHQERKATAQMSPSFWHESASRTIRGGKLLTSPVVTTFRDRPGGARILDLHSQSSCSWAWDVALEHPNAHVWTTVHSEAEAHHSTSSIPGPENHTVLHAPQLWHLPFPDEFFDVISARNLYHFLRTTSPAPSPPDNKHKHKHIPTPHENEWHATLAELHRVLRPGGYIEFQLLDAELLHPSPLAHTLGVEFGFKLRSRGFDPTPGRSFLPRLKRAGFAEIKRAWLVLPVADVSPKWGREGEVAGASEASLRGMGSTDDVRAVTGLVGARLWEQWMLHLETEMAGGDSGRHSCLDAAHKALAEAGKPEAPGEYGGQRAGWRCLVGWARKGGGT